MTDFLPVQAAGGAGYIGWLHGMLPVLSKYMDVVCFFAQNPDEDDAAARADAPSHGNILSQARRACTAAQSYRCLA
jgi:hypothetical protein